VKELEAHTNDILFIDEIHVIGAGDLGRAMDASNLLKPALASGTIRCMGANQLKSTASTSNFEKDRDAMGAAGSRRST